MSLIPRIPRRDTTPPADKPRPNPWGEAAGRRAGERDGGPSGAHPGDPAHHLPHPVPARREPALMLPGSVVAMLALLTVIQVARSGLSFGQDFEVLKWFAFIPARYSGAWTGFPGGYAADAWTFVTYALLHGSWAHLLTNGLWLVAFGSAVAKRFGVLRFWVFSAAAAAGGAGLHLAVHFGEAVPVVGASAAVAGLMAAAARFVFDAGGPLFMRRHPHDGLYRIPARTLAQTFTNRSAVAFIGIFFLINLGIGLAGSATGGVAIAWEAHLGGFLVGLLAFRLFDPVPR